MPFEGEFAPYRSLRRLVESERVKSLLGDFRIRDQTSSASFQPLTIAQIPRSDWKPNWVVAIDGSYATVDIKNGFPGAEAAYITIASVLLDIEKMNRLDQQRPVNPKDFRTIQQSESIDCALPGSNVVYSDETSARSSFRKALFDVFSSVRVFSDGESLLDTYEVLLPHRPISSRGLNCPSEDCPKPEGTYKRGKGQYQCICPIKSNLYSTDSLGIHEGMNPIGSNGATYMEIMQVWERVWVIHFLRALESRKWLSSLRRVALVMDGPLAVFGDPAWVGQAISKELQRLNEATRQATDGQDILLLGVEKTGDFVQHFSDIDQNENGEIGKFPSQSVALLTDQYIKQNIVISDSKIPYGHNTYFGRKFFYKTRTGALIVGQLPFLAEDHRDLQRAEPRQFPRLADALGLLDDLFCSRYPNAIAPLVSANAEAAIPLNLGKKVLEKLAKELMSKP